MKNIPRDIFEEERIKVGVNERICELCEQENITVEELAARLGRSHDFVRARLQDGCWFVGEIAKVFYAVGRTVLIGDCPVRKEN